VRDVKDLECFLLDMDGTIYLGERLIDGARDFLQLLEDQGKRAIFLTNNSSKNKYHYQEKLAKMGIKVDPESIFTSGEATTVYLNQHHPGARIFLLGTPQLEEEFEKAGFKLIGKENNGFSGAFSSSPGTSRASRASETTAPGTMDIPASAGLSDFPDYVVLGFDTTLTYQKLWKACDYIRLGVKFIATHPDFNCPLGEGKYMPDAGAMIKFIQASTGATPLVIGKPNPYMVDSVCKKYRVSKNKMAMVGDRLYTDIEMGNKTGVTSVLVLSGETSLQKYRSSDTRASFVFPSVKEVEQELRST